MWVCNGYSKGMTGTKSPKITEQLPKKIKNHRMTIENKPGKTESAKNVASDTFRFCLDFFLVYAFFRRFFLIFYWRFPSKTAFRWFHHQCHLHKNWVSVSPLVYGVYCIGFCVLCLLSGTSGAVFIRFEAFLQLRVLFGTLIQNTHACLFIYNNTCVYTQTNKTR